MLDPSITLRGFKIYKNCLSRPEQEALVEDLRHVIVKAPLFSPVTRWGKSMSVQMTSAGKYGWYSDRKGYRYEQKHPSGLDWPEIPSRVLQLWHDITGLERKPECCLLNFYQGNAKMGMHQDRDEANFDYPVLSVSLGDDGLFRIGNLNRGGKTESLWLASGDVVVMGGDARLMHHGMDRIKPGSSTLLKSGGRINLTLRVVE